MKINEIAYFRPDGKDCEPTGICYYKAGIYKQIEENENSFVRSTLTESFLTEKVRNPDDQYGFSKYKGGMIVFSMDVNAIIDDLEKNKIKAFLKKKYYSVMNRASKYRIVNNLISQWNKDFANVDDMYIGALTIGNNFKGKYIGDNNKIYNEKSTSIELGGVPSELLLLFAIELCRAFKQESVLVKDFNTNRIFLVDGDEIPGNTSEEKIDNAAREIAKTKNLNKLSKS